MPIIEFSVFIDCPGCERKIRKALRKLDGVENVEIDMDLQKVTVTGWIDQETLLKTVKKDGRQADLWQMPFNPVYHNFDEYYSGDYPNPSATYQYRPKFDSPDNNYYVPDPPPVTSYGYTLHDDYYNAQDYGYKSQQPVFVQPTSAMFSDENPNACSIM